MTTFKTYEYKGQSGEYFTVKYKEFDENGKQVGFGYEDFSGKRWNSTFKLVEIWTWDGEKLNKGGHRRFDCEGAYLINKDSAKVFKAFAKNAYNSKAMVQVR